MALSLTLVALLIEAAVGYPDRLYRAIGHPVTWIGALIGRLDRALNTERDDFGRRRGKGVAALLALLCVAVLPAVLLQGLILTALGPGIAGVLLLALLASPLIAQRSLYEHVARVRDALAQDGLAAGRIAVAQIVGRDPDTLDEAGVVRAALESLGESFSDGIVAPTVWLAAFGLPGGAAYKAINTADSMIGHKDERHLAFGWAAARLDDLVNLPASRLSALLIVAAALVRPGASARAAWAAVRADAGRHESPNAGWPEAALAGALGIALGGPRAYDGAVVDLPVMNAGGRRSVTVADLDAGLTLVVIADGMLIALIGALAALALALLLG